LGRERVRYIAHFVALTEPDDVREIVLNDPEMIAMVVEICREQERITATDDPLLAEVGRTPIDFQRELVGFYDLRRLGKSLAHLRKERQVAVRGCLVVHERRIRQLGGAASGCTLDEGTSSRVIPRLCRSCPRRERNSP